MSKRIVDYDPATGVTTYFEYEADTDTSVISTVQDVEPILERNKLLSNNSDYTKQGIKESWWHYADIPNVLIEKWLREDGIDVYNKDHERAVFRKLNDPQYRFLKVTAKHHS